MSIRRMTGEAFAYTVGNVFEASAGVVVTAVIGRYLAPAELGIADVITATTGIVYFFVCINLDQALIRYYYDGTDDDRTRLATTHLVFTTANGVLMIALGVLLVHQFRELLAEHAAWVCALVMVSVLALVDHVTTLLRLRHEPTHHVAVVAVRGTGWALFVSLLLVGWNAGVISLFAGRLIGASAALVVGFRWLRHAYARRGNLSLALRSARFALPTVPAGLASWAMLHAPRYFLALGASYEEVGYYGIGVRISYLISLVGVGISMAWSPFIMGIKDQPESRATLGRGLLYFTVFNVAVVIPFIVLAREVVHVLVGPTYLPASGLVGPMVVATMLSNIALFLFVQISIAERTYWQSLSYFAGVFVMGVFNVVLVPRWQSTGAVYATLAGQIVIVSVMFAVAQRFVRMPVPAGRMVAALGIVAAMLGLALWVARTGEISGGTLAVKFLLVVFGWGACVAVVGPKEMRSLVALGRSIFARR